MSLSPFPWLPVLTGISYTIGLIWAWRKIGDSPRKFQGISVQARREWLVPSSLLLLFGALIGSRLGFVLLHPGQYQATPERMLQFWEGGLDWVGIPLSMGILCLLYAGLKNAPPLVLLEDQITIWTLVTTSWWMACGFYGLYYGPAVSDAGWAPRLVDAMGQYSTRFPLSWVGAFLTLLAGSTLEWLSTRLNLQKNSLIAWLFQFALLVFLSYFREDPVAPIAAVPSDRLAGFAYLIICLAGLIAMCMMKRKKHQDIKLK